MKKILVTGGLGFIGSELTRQLLKDPNNLVYVVDDQSSSIMGVDYFRYTMGNTINLDVYIKSVNQFFKDGVHGLRFDEIYHLASPVGPAGVLNKSGRMIKEVVHDIYEIVEYCQLFDSKLVDISTSEIYGGGDNDGLCSEQTLKIFPPETTIRMEYAIAKLAAETAMINTARVTSLDSAIIRPFNVAGPRQSSKGGFVIPRFVQQAMNNEPITVFGDGSDIRSFTHVSDLVDGMIRAMDNEIDNVLPIYNLGNSDNTITIQELATKVLEHFPDSTSKIMHVDPKAIYGDQYAAASDKYADAAFAMKELEWRPEKTIDDIITDYTDEFLKQKQMGVCNDIMFK